MNVSDIHSIMSAGVWFWSCYDLNTFLGDDWWDIYGWLVWIVGWEMWLIIDKWELAVSVPQRLGAENSLGRGKDDTGLFSVPARVYGGWCCHHSYHKKTNKQWVHGRRNKMSHTQSTKPKSAKKPLTPNMNSTTCFALYGITCCICKGTYIGSTTRPLHEKAKEHIAAETKKSRWWTLPHEPPNSGASTFFPD